MHDLIRESAFGQLARFVFPKQFAYPEEVEGFQIPWFQEQEKADAKSISKDSDEPATSPDEPADTPDEKEEVEAAEPAEPKKPAELEARNDYNALMHQETQVEGVRSPGEQAAFRSPQLTRSISRVQTRPWSIERHQTELQETVSRRTTTVIQPEK